MALTNLKLAPNPGKTKFIIFSRKQKATQITHNIITIDGTFIEKVPDYKYLGILMDEKPS